MGTSVPPIAVLPLPTEEDSLPVLDIKLSSYLYVVHIGTSINAATGSDVDKSKIETPETRAINGMKPCEREYFEAWKRQSLVELPHIDWSADRRHTPTSQRPLKKALRRAEALNRIYSTDKAEPCHYTYFVENHLLWLPLVTAVARVIGAERDQSKMSMKLQAEVRDFSIIQKIVKIALRVIHQSDDSYIKARAREKVQSLDATMRSRQQIQASCLGKRKDREEDRCQILDSNYKLMHTQLMMLRKAAERRDEEVSSLRSEISQLLKTNAELSTTLGDLSRRARSSPPTGPIVSSETS
jgi:hypothetical protein